MYLQEGYGICSISHLFDHTKPVTPFWETGCQALRDCWYHGEIMVVEFGRSQYKGHMDKIKGEGRRGGGRWDWLGWGGGMGRKCRQLY